MAAVVVLCAVLGACTRAPQKPPVQPSPGAAQAAPAPAAAPAQAPVAPSSPQRPAGALPAGAVVTPPAPAAPAAPISPAAPPRPVTPPPQKAAPPLARNDSLQSLFAQDRERKVLPEDFRTGPLAGGSDLEGDDRLALTAASRFLAALGEGKVSRELLSSGASAVGESMAFHKEQGDTLVSYRLGKPKPREGGEIATNVRLFGREGTAEGEIYMVSENRQWLVSDLQISMADLRVKRQKQKEKFFPSSYRWLLGE